MVATELTTEMAFPPPANATQRLVQIAAPESDLTDKVFAWCWDAIVDKRVFRYEPKHKSVRERYIEMPWGAKLVGKTTLKPESLRGEGLVASAIDEDALVRPLIFERFIERNLMDSKGWAIRITTPEGRSNHSYKTFMDWSELAEHDPLYHTAHFTSYDNPNLPEGEVARIEERLRKAGLYDIFRQDYLAEFVALSGAVYPMFTPLKDGIPWHVQDFTLLEKMPFVLGIDWGFKNPSVCLFAQVRGDTLWVFDEIYQRGLTVPEFRDAVLARIEQHGCDVEMGYPDPSDPGSIKLFRDAGIPMFSASGAKDRTRINSVTEGLISVRSMFGREGRPGIVFHKRNCPNAIREHESYTFSDRALDEKPVKADDHAPDAMRYMVQGRLGAETPMVWIWD